MKNKSSETTGLIAILYFVSVVGTMAMAQADAAKTLWNINNPFEHKVFIENKGQFDGQDNLSSTIRYAVANAGVNIYFTSGGLTYRHDEIQQSDEEAGEDKREKNKYYEDKKRAKSISHYVHMYWMGANPDAQIIAEDIVSHYFTYPDLNDESGKTGIKALAYKKIIYKNLYPNIDVEYILPEKGGIKYNLTLHPGADISVIKMKYKFAENIKADKEGNIIIKTVFGNFVDHAPHTYYESDKLEINSVFVLNGNEVSFHIDDNYDKSKTVIIDPWIMDPIFPVVVGSPQASAFNAACDINYDVNGNVYIYGGWWPFRLMKYDNAGVLQWTYFATSFLVSSCDTFLGNYADFAVDELSGTSYILGTVGCNGNSSRVAKVNTLGIQTGMMNGVLGELWRIEYNRCLQKIVVGGGGVPPQTTQAFILDTNMIAPTPVNVLGATSGYNDICLLAIDPMDPFCYMAVAKNSLTGAPNKMIKCPIPNLIPSVVLTADNGHKFSEVNSVQYTGHFVPLSNVSNGFNGMACSPNWLYTYDSDSLKRWDKNTGAFMAGIDVSSSLPTISGGEIKVFWGGLSVDECDNIYVGVMDTIKVYDSSLVQTGYFKVPNSVYDVKLGPNNKLYACGKAFVTEIDVPPNNVVVNITQTSSTCSPCNGTATITIVSCVNPNSFSYLWMPSGQTTQMATGLCPNNYTVTVNCFPAYTSTVTIIGTPALTAIATHTPAICGTNNGSANVTAGGGTPAYTYVWNTTPAQTSSTATGLGAGTYTVTITDANNCTQTATVAVTQPAGPTANAGTSATITVGNSTTLTASGGGTYSWSNGATTAAVAVAPAVTTIYCVTVTDANNCTDNACVTVYVETPCSNISLPNAFSPNDDEENDNFCLQGGTNCIKELSIIIYNRWGEKVFESTDPAFCWDGTYKGKLINTAVFVYYLEATLITGEQVTKKGNISLIR